jgi:hypothetical protein
LNILISPDDTVVEDKIILSYGRLTKYYQNGEDYKLTVVDQSGAAIWSQAFNIYFDYNGPVYLDVDYSKIRYKNFPFHYKIPYIRGMHKLVLDHKNKIIFYKILNFCNKNKICDSTETHLTCPCDCPLDKKDKICIPRKDGICDPDCLEGVDPDCDGECGNNVCNSNENHGNCPQDCPSGRRDGYCDGKKDGRCDPDCKEGEDPDCKRRCGDGVCASCANAIDQYACENHGNCPGDCPSGGKDYYCDKKADGICDPDCKEGEDPDCKKKLYSVSLHLGFTIPIGNFNNNYDPGYSIGLDFDYHFTPKFSVVGLLGYNHFNSGSFLLSDILLSDTYWWNISANLKYEFTTNPLRAYVNGGPGIYIPKSGSIRPGLNFGLGLDYSLTSNWTIELGGEYHHIFTSGSDIEFIVPHIGVIYRF